MSDTSHPNHQGYDLAEVVRNAAPELARCALEVIRRQFPHKLDHMILDADDVRLPSVMHPVFAGCYDWHSSVHMHWSLLRLLAMQPEMPQASEIRDRFDSSFAPELVEQELAYVLQPGRSTFERPYGWAWLLKLQQELVRQVSDGREDAAPWASAMQPLADELACRLRLYLRNIDYPVRPGTHTNTAFALLLALDYAEEVGDEALISTIGSSRRPLSFPSSCTDQAF